MAYSINHVTLAGNLGKDAETREVAGGRKVTKTSLATEETWKDGKGETQKKTTWHNLVIWGRPALNDSLKKGTKVALTGKIENRSWEDGGVKKYITEIIVDQLFFVSSASHAAQQSNEGYDEWSGQASSPAPAAQSNGQPPVQQQTAAAQPAASSEFAW